MSQSRHPRRGLGRLLPAFLVLAVGAFGAAAPGQTAKLRYTLEDVWLLPDVSHPWLGPQQMTGSFEWTYTVGDFENGSGQFLDLYIPWYGSNFSGLTIVVDLDSIEFVLPGNWHGLGVDLTLFLLTNLDPKLPSAVDPVRSIFHVENGISYQGHVIGGSVVPQPQLSLTVQGSCPLVQFLIEGAVAGGNVALLYAFGEGAAVVPGGYPCAGTVLGLDGTTQLGAVLVASAAGGAGLTTNVPPGACGRVYLQALDLTSCGLSPVVLLQ